ncbi:MAG: hypothetical protein ACI92Z_000098 [Paracoccaceae bacterium]|jgi:hypothetical protein
MSMCGWDAQNSIFVGTFVYHPGVPPAELGLHPDTGLPPYKRTIAVLALPFRAKAK